MNEQEILHRFIVMDEEGIKNVCGIYAILNKKNGHIYIGQSIDMLARKKSHFSELKCNRHDNQYLQNAYNLYGRFKFGFVVVEVVKNKEDLNLIEQHWIERLTPEYNIQYNVFNPYPSKFEGDDYTD